MDFGYLLSQLRSRVDVMVARAVVTLVNDALKTQRVQLRILKNEGTDDKVEHFQPYGLSFVPPVGSEAVALAVGGSRGHTIAVCVQHPDHRPKGAHEHEGGLYSKGQWRVFVDADGIVHIGAKTGASAPSRADKNDAEIKRIWDLLTKDWKPIAQDGGAALQIAALKAVAQVQSTAATKSRIT